MFEQGQTIIIERGGKPIRVTSVRKVWKNGVVEVETGDKHRGALFNPDGYARGWDSSHSPNKIRPLADGETVESVQATIEKRATDAATAQDRKEIKHQYDIAEWWDNVGNKIWANRQTLPKTFFGRTVHVLRYTRDMEEHMPMVVVNKRKNEFTGLAEFDLTVGGLVGRKYEYEDEEQNYINTSTTSISGAASLQEALYKLCN